MTAQPRAATILKLTGIVGPVRFLRRRAIAPVLAAENLMIENARQVDLRLQISFNPMIGSKTFNVSIPGVGPVCRLDVGGPPHRPAGRNHKHSLLTPRCPDQNLRENVADHPELDGWPLRYLFDWFCNASNIRFDGELFPPQEEAAQ